MANEMIKFFKGLEASLPAAGTNGALYITTDEGAIYLGTGTGMKRLGDFVQVANVASLPTKAHENCLYYCVAENILAKWNGAEWKQVNKQPTTEELKTLLGLGSMAYKSSVAEADLTAELAEKVNAAAEGNHAHANKTVLDGITADKVTAWDAAEKNAKDHADGLNTAMNTRVEALEAIDHDHANKAELDLIASGDKAKWDAATAKAHEHANADELAKIADGDKAKWDAVAADHLTSADKTTLENAIKDAKKAGTDANTNIETYKVANDARVLAVEEDIAEITGDNGILAQAKSYTDGKDSAMNTRVAALETAAPTHALKTEVEAVDAKFANYKTAADQKLVDDAQDAEIAKKVDKVEGKSLVSDTEITKLAGVSAGANKVEASANNGSIKIDGVETVVYTHPEKHAIADVTGLQDALDGKQAAGDYAAEVHTHVASDITDLDSTIKGYDYATKTEAKGYADAKDEAIAAALQAGTDAQGEVDALETYVGTFTASEGVDTVVKYIDAKTANIASDERVNAIDNRVKAIEDDYVVAADIADFETKENVKKVADDLAAYVTSNDEALAGVKATAEAARTEDEVNSQIDAKITALNLGTTYEPIGAEDRAKAYAEGLITDANLDQYTTEQEVKDIVDGVIAGAVDGDTITGLANLVEYLNTHGTEAKEMGAAIDVLEGKVETIEGKPAYGITATQISNWDGEVGAKALADTKLDASTFTAYEQAHASDYTNKQIDDAIDADVKAAIDAEVLRANGAYDVKGAASDAQAAAEATAAGALATARTEITAEIDADVKVVNDALEAYKTANNAEVAKKANSADVYTKDETFTKDEVNALFTWGSF